MHSETMSEVPSGGIKQSKHAGICISRVLANATHLYQLAKANQFA
jgi:hypothetical protein